MILNADMAELVGIETVNNNTEIQCTECGSTGKIAFQYITRSANLCMCENCAVKMARILFQDVLAYQNGVKSIDLTQLMFHGTKDINKDVLPPGIRPCGMVAENSPSPLPWESDPDAEYCESSGLHPRSLFDF